MARHGSESVGVAAGAEVAAAGPDQATSADAPGATGFADYLHSHRYQRLSGQMRWWELARERGGSGTCCGRRGGGVGHSMWGGDGRGARAVACGISVLSGVLGLFFVTSPVLSLAGARGGARVRREGSRARD